MLGHDAGGDLGLELAQDPAPAALSWSSIAFTRPGHAGFGRYFCFLWCLGWWRFLQLVVAEGAGDDRRGVVRMPQ